MNHVVPGVTRLTGRVMVVNSYLFDCGSGVSVIDAQLCRSDAEAVRAAVEATGKPLLAVLVTHPHPDHYAGAATLTAGLDVPLIATRDVAAVIERDDAEKARIVGPMMGEEWPAQRRFPDQLVDDGETVRLGELDLRVRSWGPGESHADTVWAVGEETLFVGDLLYNEEHAYLADGHGQQWLRNLTRLQAEVSGAATLYPGHGAPGGVGLFEAQRQYIATFLGAVQQALDMGPDERERLVLAAVEPLARSDALLFLARLSIEPTAASLKSAGSQSSAGGAGRWRPPLA